MYRDLGFSAEFVIVVSGKYAFAIEALTGMTKWAYALNVAPCRAVVANERVYLAGDHELACVDFATGKERFHVRTDLAPDVTLVVDGERIFVGADGRVACFDQVGQRLWSNDLGTGSGVGFALPGFAQQIDLKG